jgi:hypothetical protein
MKIMIVPIKALPSFQNPARLTICVLSVSFCCLLNSHYFFEKFCYSKAILFFCKKIFMEDEMTYEKIMVLINEQKRLTAEGKMECLPLHYGFSAEAAEVFRNGTDVRAYFGLPQEELHEQNRFVRQHEAYA